MSALCQPRLITKTRVSRFRLQLEAAPEGVQSVTDLVPGSYIVGSSPDADIQLAISTISRQHARLEVLPSGGLILEDLDSTNGTFCNGHRIARVALTNSVAVSFGKADGTLLPIGQENISIAIAVGSGESVSAASVAGPEHASTAALDLTSEALEVMGQTLAQAMGAEYRFVQLANDLFTAWMDALPLQGIALIDRQHDTVTISLGQCDKSVTHLSYESPAQYRIAVWCSPALDRRLAPVIAFLLALGGEVDSHEESSIDPGVETTSYGAPTHNPAVISLLKDCAKIARSALPVMILGESGTGKELLARWVHDRSERADRPFIALNCAALPKDLQEAELFGIEKGTATGVGARAGLIEQADGGTLFLDELGDMAADTQAKLLRALESEAIVRLGGSRVRDVNVRFVSATNQALQRQIDAGSSRLDLYHRLAGYEAQLPPPRARQEDIPGLATHFLRHFMHEYGKQSPGLTHAALVCLLNYQWPGNIRELRNEMARAVLLLEPGEPLDVARFSARLHEVSAQLPSAASLSLADAVTAAERKAFKVALSCSAGNAAQAMELLGLSKTGYYRKLKELGIGSSSR